MHLNFVNKFKIQINLRNNRGQCKFDRKSTALNHEFKDLCHQPTIISMIIDLSDQNNFIKKNIVKIRYIFGLHWKYALLKKYKGFQNYDPVFFWNRKG